MKNCYRCNTPTDLNVSKVCTKCGGELVSVSEFFYAALEVLNEKGYYIKSASAGSIDSPATIVFDECVDSFPVYTESVLRYKITTIKEEDNRHIKFTKNFNEKDIYTAILSNSILTYLWSIKLPAVGSNEYFEELAICYLNNIKENIE